MSVIFSDCFRFIPGNNWFSHFSFVIFSFYESSALRVLKDSPACELREVGRPSASDELKYPNPKRERVSKHILGREDVGLCFVAVAVLFSARKLQSW